MEVKLFYRTQRDLALGLNKIIDAYWNEEIKETELIEGVNNIYANNLEKMMKDNQFTKIVQQQSGKRRLAVVERILHMNEKNIV